MEPNGTPEVEHTQPVAKPETVLERLGRYVLLEKIAQGGMAEVFRAAAVGSSGFAKMLAIKRVLPVHARDPNFISMFIDEARIASGLNHPNVLQVLDLGHEGGAHYLVMEYVAGGSLARVMAQSNRRGIRFPAAMACHVVLGALEGLSFAHRKKDPHGRPLDIIHRDVSPHNIMLSFDGAVKLADFGIAKASSRLGQDTATGMVKGKPGYFAPEQMSEKFGPPDQRLDVYAMGVVLWECLALRRMRQGDEMKVLGMVMEGSHPTLASAGAEVPPGIDAVVEKALAPQVAERFATSQEFHHALQAEAIRAGWQWSAPQSADFLAQLFAEDILQEQHAERRYNTLITALANQATDEISGVHKLLAQVRQEFEPVEVSLATTTSDVRQIVDRAAVAPARAARVVRLLAAAAVVGAVAVGGWAWTHRPGTLVVSSTPGGAEVTIKGRGVVGRTPLVLRDLEAGAYELVVALPGHVETGAAPTVQNGQATTVDVRLEAVRRSVRIVTTPPGAMLVVDGKTLGPSPRDVELSGVQAEVLAMLDGHQPLRRQVDVAGAPTELPLVLEPVPRAAAAPPAPEPADTGRREPGRITLQSRPWARVFIDGKDTGRFTPLVEHELPAGTHAVRLVNDAEQLSTTFRVVVAPGKHVSVTKSLQ